MTSDDNGEKTAAEMVNQMQDFFASREKALKEREEALEKRLKLFDENYPEAVKDSDVLHLNVGGSTNIAVLRRTLTHFENSMLASRFSGRWDDSIENDKHGNFFIDQDPQVFGILLKYLRQCDQCTGHDTMIQSPPASYDFCTMLEYYGLMSSVYPQKWLGVFDDNDFTTTTNKDESLTISRTGNSFKAISLEVQNDCPTKPVNARSFNVITFKQGSTGQVGWATGISKDCKLGRDKDKKIICL